MTRRLLGPHAVRAFFSISWASAALALSASGALAASLGFDKVFNATGEPAQLSFTARYLARGSWHTVKVWRDRDQRLKRVTDDALETYLSKPSGEPEWKMTVLDLKRSIRTDIDRTNLYRIGHFNDWFGFSHALTRPQPGYELKALPAFNASEKPLSPCRWYALQRDGRENRICWSSKWHLPMLITEGDKQVVWQVTAASAKLPDADVFAIRDQGFVRNDANSDISAD